MNNNTHILSLFSGGGFLDLGFMNQGFQVEGACEIVPEFISSYNHGVKSYIDKSKRSEIVSNKIIHKEIEDIVDISLKSHQQHIHKLYKNTTEGIIGGPPCQDYSVGGKNAGVEGNRGKLIFSYLEIIKLNKPNFIFFENVSGLFNTKNHQTAFFDLVKELENSGYSVWFKILNSLDYGIPQDRSRLMLVGFKNTIVKRLLKSGYKIINDKGDFNELAFKWPEKQFINPKSLKWPKIWTFGQDIRHNEVNEIPDKYEKLFVVNAFKNLSENSPNQQEFFVPYSNKFSEIHEGDTNRKSFKRLHRYKYSPTVAYGNNEVHLHPTEPRRLSVREALRLQTVPDSYILPDEVSLTHKFKLISNGVPTKMAGLVAKEIKRTMDNYYSIL